MKRLIALSLALLLLLALAGCKAGERAETAAPSSGAEATRDTGASDYGKEPVPETESAPETEPAPETDPALESAMPHSETEPTETEPTEPQEPGDPGKPEAPPAEPGPGDPVPFNPVPVDIDDDLPMHRQPVLDSGAICGVLFLGFVDPDAPSFAEDPALWKTFLAGVEYAEDFTLLNHIPADRILETGGTEVYCFFPLEDDASVTVWYAEPDGEAFEPVPVECVYHGDGRPFILRCNVSDIMPNAEVNVMDPDGRTLTWNPFLSLENSHISMPGSSLLYDATPYWEE